LLLRKTPGKCIIADDMHCILEKHINAELIICSFQFYYYSAPSETKALIDRLLPANLPDIIANTEGSKRHQLRCNLQKQRYIFISTCGLFTVQHNYDGLLKWFEIMCGGGFAMI
jgi:putative NADPH-quinone reductase